MVRPSQLHQLAQGHIQLGFTMSQHMHTPGTSNTAILLYSPELADGRILLLAGPSGS